MYEQLLSHIHTTQDADMLLDEIDTVRNSLYLTKPDALEQVLAQSVRASVTGQLRQLLNQPKVQRSTILDELAHWVGSLPRVRITIAFEPTPAFITTIVRQLRARIATALVDINIDTRIVAGAIIEIDGTYHDRSVKKKIEGALAQMKEEMFDPYE